MQKCFTTNSHKSALGEQVLTNKLKVTRYHSCFINIFFEPQINSDRLRLMIKNIKGTTDHTENTEEKKGIKYKSHFMPLGG